MLPRHFEGWRLTHDLLGDCAPRHADFDGECIRSELIPGVPLHAYYGGMLAGRHSGPLPWTTLWAALNRLYESGRAGPQNPKLIPEMAWTTWFSIVRLPEARWHAAYNGWLVPWWSVRTARALVQGKLQGGFARTPAVTYEITKSSRSALILGDMHMANLVGGSDRIAFVDFSEVGEGPIALDLAPLWFEWWLGRGLTAGDDGFIEGFSEMWRRYVGPESLLVRMTGEWAARMFPWMLFAFYADHLGLPREQAYVATSTAIDRLDAIRDRWSSLNRLHDLVATADE